MAKHGNTGDAQDRRRFEARMIFKHKTLHPGGLKKTLPSYKHPEFIHSSNIGIVFDLNVYTRAHFSLRAQIISNSNFYRYERSVL